MKVHSISFAIVIGLFASSTFAADPDDEQPIAGERVSKVPSGTQKETSRKAKQAVNSASQFAGVNITEAKLANALSAASIRQFQNGELHTLIRHLNRKLVLTEAPFDILLPSRQNIGTELILRGTWGADPKVKADIVLSCYQAPLQTSRLWMTHTLFIHDPNYKYSERHAAIVLPRRGSLLRPANPKPRFKDLTSLPDTTKLCKEFLQAPLSSTKAAPASK